MNAPTRSSFFPPGTSPLPGSSFLVHAVGGPALQQGHDALLAWFLAGKALVEHGPWHYRRSTNELVLDRVPNVHGGYEIDLDQCPDDESVGMWLRHVAEKRWADDACLAGLVRALDYWATVVRPLRMPS